MAEYIRGEKLIDKASRMCIECEENNSERCNECLAACVLDDERVADVAPVRHGRWVVSNIIHEHYTNRVRILKSYKCSVCDVPTEDYKYHYCPNCGARMDGAE